MTARGAHRVVLEVRPPSPFRALVERLRRLTADGMRESHAYRAGGLTAAADQAAAVASARKSAAAELEHILDTIDAEEA